MKHLLHGLPNLRGAALDARGNGQSIAEAMRDVRTKGQDGKKRHGDAAIAFVLAYYASRELNTGPIRVASRRIRRKSALTKGY